MENQPNGIWGGGDGLIMQTEVRSPSATTTTVHQANSYDTSYSTLAPPILPPQHRSRSYDDRYLQGVPTRPPYQYVLDKESQNQIDEFEEVITRMATMTRCQNGSRLPPYGASGSCLPPYGVNGHENQSSIDSGSLSNNKLDWQQQQQLHQRLQFPTGDDGSRYCSPCSKDTNRGGPGNACCTSRISPRSTPYPPPVPSPSGNFDSTSIGPRRHSGSDQLSRRSSNSSLVGPPPSPQVKIQVNDCFMYEPNYPVGLPPLAPPQSVNTISTSSRTQMKQQLMRQQLQEQEAKEKSVETQQQILQQSPHPINQQQPIQINSQTTTTVSSQPLQVNSRLENPTKYHVVQSHKRALRQKLTDKSDEEDTCLIDPAVTVESAPGALATNSFTPSASYVHRQYPCSDPGQRGYAVATDVSRDVGQVNPGVVIPNGLMGYSPCRPPALTHSRTSSSVSENPAKAVKYTDGPRRRHSNTSQECPVNSFRSSAARPVSITSDASEVNDVIEEILSLEENLEAEKLKKCSIKSPNQQTDEVPDQICDLLGLNGVMGNKVPTTPCSESSKVKAEPHTGNDPQVVAFIKDRQKKDNHNMIERRRRFNINDRIKDLSRLLPKTNEPYHELVRDIRYNKGQILRASVDYIQRLKIDLDRGKTNDRVRVTLEQNNRQLVVRVRELENLLRSNGIPIEETKIDSSILLPTIAQSDLLSPLTSPFTPTSPPPSQQPTPPITSYESTPPALMNNVPSTADLAELCFPSSEAVDSNPLFDQLVGFVESNDPKKVRCPAPFQEIPWDEILDEFSSGNFGLNLMEDENLSFADDPMLFSSPPMSSPNSSHHSFEDALTPESMDIVS